MLTALSQKLVRDLGRLRGQVVTIALVVACGIASFVALQGNYGSLERARNAFYERQRFADLFAQLERAPESVLRDLEQVPGIERIQARVVESAMLPLAQIPDPVRARVVALPEEGHEALNAIRLRDGRRPESGHDDEAVLLEGFAEAHGIGLGDSVPAVINGRQRELRIVGTATSPEYVIAIGSGSLAADPERFAVLWMNSEPLEAAFEMKSSFNDVSFALTPGASQARAIDAIDRILVPYGGLGAYPRSRQLSNQVLEGELLQLRGMSKVLPAIFLAVASLLVHMVLSRLVHLQQPEIATLKAIGYSNGQVGLHFLELVLVVSWLGTVAGIGVGRWLGAEMVELYTQYFKLPDLGFHFSVRDVVVAVGVTFASAAAGAFSAVRRAVRLPPAEAMQPPMPARYARSVIDRLGLARLVGPSAHMVVRELQRRPLRAALSIVAISAATGLSVVGGWYYDGIRILLETQFHAVMREDAAVTFIKPLPARAIRELAELPGVLAAEGLRIVPVHFRSGHRRREGAVWGYPDGIEMRGLRDRFARPVALPPSGIVLTDMLGEILGVEPGDTVELEIQEGHRGVVRVVVAGLVDESFGLQGHMRFDALAHALGEQDVVSLGLLRTDPNQQAELDARLKELPQVADVTRRASLLERFEEQSANMILTVAVIISLFAATITIGVVYNNARIALAMRARDLASLRVLGFTRREISSVLLGELSIQVLLAVPIGLIFGRLLVGWLATMVDPETYRLPVFLTLRSYAFGASVTLVAALISALIVRRRIDRLDLIQVLKTRE